MSDIAERLLHGLEASCCIEDHCGEAVRHYRIQAFKQILFSPDSMFNAQISPCEVKTLVTKIGDDYLRSCLLSK